MAQHSAQVAPTLPERSVSGTVRNLLGLAQEADDRDTIPRLTSWPTRRGGCCMCYEFWDEHGDYVEDDLRIIIQSITISETNADPMLLTKLQAFELLRMFRMAGAMAKSGMKWVAASQLAAIIATISSASAPVVVGIQMLMPTRGNAWFLCNMAAMLLSLIATLCVAIERARGMKDQGVMERMAAAQIKLELKNFLAGKPNAGHQNHQHHRHRHSTFNYRKHFPPLATRVHSLQHKGTIDLYKMLRSKGGLLGHDEDSDSSVDHDGVDDLEAKLPKPSQEQET